MTRFLLLLLSAQLAALAVATAAEPSELHPQDAYDAGIEAIEAGDARRALALLGQAADAGHLDALRRLEEAYGGGTLRADVRAGAASVPVRPSERRAERVRSAYARFMSDAVRAGDAEATRHAIREVLGVRLLTSNRARLPPPMREHWDATDLDSVRALYRVVAEAPGASQTSLALIARALGDGPAFERHLDRAIAGGEPHACVYRVEAQYGPPDYDTAAGLAADVDRMVACHPANAPDGPGLLDGFRQSAARGSERSAEMLDSLQALGLFERYPQLARR